MIRKSLYLQKNGRYIELSISYVQYLFFSFQVYYNVIQSL